MEEVLYIMGEEEKSRYVGEREKRASRSNTVGATTQKIRIVLYALRWAGIAYQRTVCVEAKRAVIVLIANSLHQRKKEEAAVVAVVNGNQPERLDFIPGGEDDIFSFISDAFLCLPLTPYRLGERQIYTDADK